MVAIQDMGESGPSAHALLARVRSAILWRSGTQVLGQLVMWCSTFMVLRVLTPGDYGLFAMTQVVIALVQLMNGYAFASSLVQAKAIDNERAGQVFGMLILMNISMAALQFLLAPVAADYFHHPVLTSMLRVQCLLHLITPFIIVPQALLARDMDFRTQGRANLGAALVGALAGPSFALLGLGVWTLVFAPISFFATRAIMMGVLGRWWIQPRFNFRGASAVFGYGSLVLLSDILWFIQSQADIFIAGRHFDAHRLGLYSEGLFLTQILVNKFVPALNDVALPAYARLQADREAVAKSFAAAVSVVMLVSLPCYIGLAATAHPLVITAMGVHWAEAAPVVQILALAMPFLTLHILYTPVTNALGHPKVGAACSASGAALMPCAFLIGVHYGPAGMALSWVAGMPLLLLLSTRLSLPIIGLDWRRLVQAVYPPCLASLAMGAVVVLVEGLLPEFSPAVRLAWLVGVGVFAYALFVALLARRTAVQAFAMLWWRPR